MADTHTVRMPIATPAVANVGTKVVAPAIAATASADFRIVLIVLPGFEEPPRRHDAVERSLGAPQNVSREGWLVALGKQAGSNVHR